MIIHTPAGRVESPAAAEPGLFDLLLPAERGLIVDLRSDERIDIKLFLG
jgi:hypothetical protein